MVARVHALMPAAGRSVRFGGVTLKQYTHLSGTPVISHSIEAVLRHEAVHARDMVGLDDQRGAVRSALGLEPFERALETRCD